MLWFSQHPWLWTLCCCLGWHCCILGLAHPGPREGVGKQQFSTGWWVCACSMLFEAVWVSVALSEQSRSVTLGARKDPYSARSAPRGHKQRPSPSSSNGTGRVCRVHRVFTLYFCVSQWDLSLLVEVLAVLRGERRLPRLQDECSTWLHHPSCEMGLFPHLRVTQSGLSCVFRNTRALQVSSSV